MMHESESTDRKQGNNLATDICAHRCVRFYVWKREGVVWGLCFCLSQWLVCSDDCCSTKALCKAKNKPVSGLKHALGCSFDAFYSALCSSALTARFPNRQRCVWCQTRSQIADWPNGHIYRQSNGWRKRRKTIRTGTISAISISAIWLCIGSRA